MFLRLLCAALLALSLPAFSADAPKMSAAQFVQSLNFQKGKITLPEGMAVLDLPDAFRYLSPADAERVLVDAWGNPPGNKSLGMIVPADGNLLSDDAWAVIVTYDRDGHVKDDDANKINYTDLLKDMQKGVEENNEVRKKEGYSSMTLTGWAEAPRYDQQTHKLYWAKELNVEGAKEHSLNYNIRVLGREGVLVLNAVAGMHQIASIKEEMKKVTAFSEFTPGNRYADFDSKTDKVAEYGIAALVAGGVAAKLGFFGKIFAVLLAFKKLVIGAVVFLGAGVAKFFGRKKDDSAAS